MKKKVSVLGIGRLGLCFAITLEKGGYSVVGYDIREDYVKSIRDLTFETCEPGVSDSLKKCKNLRVTVYLEEAVSHGDVLFVTVRTGSLSSGKFDHSQVEQLMGYLKSLGVQPVKKDLVICCNVSPGYSNEVHEQMKDYNYTVSFNPEWVAQGTILYNQSFPDVVVIGEGSKESGDIIEEIYSNICVNNPTCYRMDRLSAEIAKVSLNCYITMKLSFANFVGDMALTAGVNPEVILKAVGTDSRVGNAYFKYGFGYGGYCFPRDNKALIHYSESLGIDPVINRATEAFNKNHLDMQVSMCSKKLDDNGQDSMTMRSVAYKPGVTYIESSQQLLFAVKMAERGYKITIEEDPIVIEQVKSLYGDLFEYKERGTIL